MLSLNRRPRRQPITSFSRTATITRVDRRPWLHAREPGSGRLRGELPAHSDHEKWMHLAIEEAELARGTTGNNPWVGCAIVSPESELLGRGHTLGPGEDHAEIAAARYAQGLGKSVVGATLYSTLEPCSFHGRTPACARAIAERGIVRPESGKRFARRAPRPAAGGDLRRQRVRNRKRVRHRRPTFGGGSHWRRCCGD